MSVVLGVQQLKVWSRVWDRTFHSHQLYTTSVGVYTVYWNIKPQTHSMLQPHSYHQLINQSNLNSEQLQFDGDTNS